MALADLPAPDLFIRTGGELRISNFLLWQLAYTELWFTDALWPDVDAGLLQAALDDYAGRERRFGLTSAQLAATRLRRTDVTKTRILAALVMAPAVIGAVLLLPTDVADAAQRAGVPGGAVGMARSWPTSKTRWRAASCWPAILR